MAETKPGSRAHRLVTLIGAAAEERGRGISTAELRELYETETGEKAPASLTSEVSSLKRRGVLAIVGGRPGHSLYAPVGMELDSGAPVDDDALLVLAALHHGYERLGRALSTREVDTELEHVDGDFTNDHPDAVRKYLETLTQPTERGPADFREPRVRRITATSMLGQQSNHWVPAEVEAPDGELVAPRSRADAAREAVQRAGEALGRPPSMQELRWWLEGPGRDTLVAQVLEPGEAGRRLSDTARADGDHAGEPGRLQRVTTHFTCHGGQPVRWTTGELSNEARSLCELEDVLLALRVPEELRSLRGLEGLADRRRSDALHRLVATRRELLMSNLRRAAGREDWKAALEELDEVRRELELWIASTPDLSGDQRSDRHRRPRELREAIDAARGALTFIRGGDEGREVTQVGEAATVSLAELEPMLEDAGRMLGIGGRKLQQLVVEARRFPVPEEPGQERIGQGDEQPLSVLDRVDALTEVFSALSLPRAHTLLTSAHQLLGHVFRDDDYLRDLLLDLPDEDTPTRGALAVALGLLGKTPSFGEVVSNPESVDLVRALVFGLILSEWSSSSEAMGEHVGTLRGPALRVGETALRRLEGGQPVSAIE